jgi:hypothetical protein
MLQLAFFNMYPYLFNKLSKLKDRLEKDVVFFNKERIDRFGTFIKENK